MAEVSLSAKSYRLAPAWLWLIAICPVVLLFAFALFLTFPPTQDFTILMLEESYPVQALTFDFALLAAILGMRVAWKSRVAGERNIVTAFYFLFSLGLVILAGEEVAWGQKLIYYPTPDFMMEINYQEEMTLHNLKGWQGNSHFLRLATGLAGMAAIRLSSMPFWVSMAAPPVLFPWFLLIALKSALDVWVKTFPSDPMFGYIVNRLSEVIELMVALSALLYIWLNGRVLIARWQDARDGANRF